MSSGSSLINCSDAFRGLLHIILKTGWVRLCYSVIRLHTESIQCETCSFKEKQQQFLLYWNVQMLSRDYLLLVESSLILPEPLGSKSKCRHWSKFCWCFLLCFIGGVWNLLSFCCVGFMGFHSVSVVEALPSLCACMYTNTQKLHICNCQNGGVILFFYPVRSTQTCMFVSKCEKQILYYHKQHCFFHHNL